MVFLDGPGIAAGKKKQLQRGGGGGGNNLKVQHCRAESERKDSQRREEVGHMLCIYANLLLVQYAGRPRQSLRVPWVRNLEERIP
jgi:hypothetical protein